MKVRIGTRGSKLALWQAYYIQDLLISGGCDTEVVIIETTGDKILDRSLSKIGSKGVFTIELEEALRNKTIDIAVHSAKDVQSDLPEDLQLIAFTEREEANDVLVSNKEVSLESEIVVGTSSTRRVALLRHFYPHVKIVDMRGNLQTRFSKMESGVCDAMILAFAGVHRMQMEKAIQEKLSIADFVPPVGQGCVAIQAKTDHPSDLNHVVRKLINDAKTEQCLLAERVYLKDLNGGCSIPVFGNARLLHNRIELTGGIVSLDGQQLIKEKAVGINSEKVGLELAEKVKSKGGLKILEEIKKTLEE